MLLPSSSESLLSFTPAEYSPTARIGTSRIPGKLLRPGYYSGRTGSGRSFLMTGMTFLRKHCKLNFTHQYDFSSDGECNYKIR
jgi:hypothetical protein